MLLFASPLSLYAPRAPTPRPRSRSRPAVASAEDDFFAATTYMTYAAVELRSGADGNSLVASRDAAAGDRLLEVPRDCCLTAHRSGVIGGSSARPTSCTTRRATCATRSARRCSDAARRGTCGSRSPCSRRQFGRRRVLGSVPAVAPAARGAVDADVPAAVAVARAPRRDALRKAAARRDELAALYPPLADAEAHPATTMYPQMGAPPDAIPSPLAWAHALVVSRCFTCADGDTFGFVPILDLCEHGDAVGQLQLHRRRRLQLRALKPIAAGEAVTISYGGDYDSRLMEQYGFSQPEGNANDARWLTELAKAAAADGGGGAPAEGEGCGAAAHADSGLDRPSGAPSSSTRSPPTTRRPARCSPACAPSATAGRRA